MKSTVFIFMFLLIQATTLSQPCLPEGITFSTQAQIDSFQINYPGCTEIEGFVQIGVYGGSNINNLNGLSVLTSMGEDLLIYSNVSLTSLTGLEGLTSVGGYFWISENNALTSLSGLENLSTIEGNFEIIHNPVLTSFLGMENLENIEGDLYINNNDSLLNFLGLNSISHIEEDLYVWGNSDLTSFKGLDGLTSIGGTLSISHNRAITCLDGLGNVESIGGNLEIMYENILINLSGLENLTSVNGALVVEFNASLTSLSGIDNIEGNSIFFLRIDSNPNLSNCAVQSICDYLIPPGAPTDIFDNNYGCNSREQIEQACETLSLTEINNKVSFKVSPNPFTTSTTLTYTLSKPSAVIISIFNPQGQLIEKIEQEQPKGEQQMQWNAEGLPAGMYYFRIQAGEMVGGGKMVKLQ